ncbi:hypothetical protein LEP1GSC199_0795 [Leptospira vanthielii serovar Holland str. Waz Holland = ATCC 700522]|uniref:Uncharacterized protein n=1 Tax=Leptospira vanthielii serovar Holland str. Waz Holland = ATCC 700522 TaxID=1218591 RepID=N1W2I6_9LEPT|nr:hypothetical protein LEP1GSC199_0795 [Leptospira vanthielii serovar Holland str. Waz Holland = ATCC 700522]
MAGDGSERGPLKSPARFLKKIPKPKLNWERPSGSKRKVGLLFFSSFVAEKLNRYFS